LRPGNALHPGILWKERIDTMRGCGQDGVIGHLSSLAMEFVGAGKIVDSVVDGNKQGKELEYQLSAHVGRQQSPSTKTEIDS